MLQLQATLQKNFTEKRRSLKSTCCETFSHFIIIILLIYGYNLSEVTPFDSENYSTIELSIPPSSNDVLSLVSGPVPIPSFDSYVSASRILQRLLTSGGFSSSAILKAIPEYDNLLYLGALHFAPDSEETRSLVTHLNSTYVTFSTMTVRIHASERSAVDYILSHLEERALALITISFAGPERVRYTIRQNYTTLPNTNQVVDDVSVGLNVEYQKYFFSGFLTLKDAVDLWAFNYSGAAASTFVPDPENDPDVPAATQTCAKPDMYFTPFPTPAFDTNIFYTQIGFLLGLALTSE
jgi:hypothetical protein